MTMLASGRTSFGCARLLQLPRLWVTGCDSASLDSSYTCSHVVQVVFCWFFVSLLPLWRLTHFACELQLDKGGQEEHVRVKKRTIVTRPSRESHLQALRGGTTTVQQPTQMLNTSAESRENRERTDKGSQPQAKTTSAPTRPSRPAHACSFGRYSTHSASQQQHLIPTRNSAKNDRHHHDAANNTSCTTPLHNSTS
jgi:hypothetical protein